jgi:hypothetical protein
MEQQSFYVIVMCNVHAYRLRKNMERTLMVGDGEQTIQRHFFSSSFEELRRYSEREQ